MRRPGASVGANSMVRRRPRQRIARVAVDVGVPDHDLPRAPAGALYQDTVTGRAGAVIGDVAVIDEQLGRRGRREADAVAAGGGIELADDAALDVQHAGLDEADAVDAGG